MLQRIIKAEEKKKRLPKQIAKLHQMLDEWASPTSHGKPFVIGTVVYKAEVLVAIESELHAMSEFKARKVCTTSCVSFRCFQQNPVRRRALLCISTTTPMCPTAN
jgi:hypothetical protein